MKYEPLTERLNYNLGARFMFFQINVFWLHWILHQLVLQKRHTQYNLHTIYIQTISPLFIMMLDLQGLWHLMWKMIWVQASKHRLLSLHHCIITRSAPWSSAEPQRLSESSGFCLTCWLAWFNTLQSGPVIELAAYGRAGICLHLSTFLPVFSRIH